MGYFNIIDSLSDKRVDEGMVSSISKNTKKQNKDIKRMIDAVLSGQISKLSSKDMGIAIEVRNRIEMILNNRKGGHSLRFLKDGKSKIKLIGGFI